MRAGVWCGGAVGAAGPRRGPRWKGKAGKAGEAGEAGEWEERATWWKAWWEAGWEEGAEGRRRGTEGSPKVPVPVNSFSQSLEHAAAAAIAGNVSVRMRKRMMDLI